MWNEELRIKNEELGGFAAYALTGVSDCSMMSHKTFGFTCESRGLRSNPNS